MTIGITLWLMGAIKYLRYFPTFSLIMLQGHVPDACVNKHCASVPISANTWSPGKRFASNWYQVVLFFGLLLRKMYQLISIF